MTLPRFVPLIPPRPRQTNPPCSKHLRMEVDEELRQRCFALTGCVPRDVLKFASVV